MNTRPPDQRPHTRRAPTPSLLYDRILPLLFIGLGIIMATLIVIATGVLLGWIQYR